MSASVSESRALCGGCSLSPGLVHVALGANNPFLLMNNIPLCEFEVLTNQVFQFLRFLSQLPLPASEGCAFRAAKRPPKRGTWARRRPERGPRAGPLRPTREEDESLSNRGRSPNCPATGARGGCPRAQGAPGPGADAAPRRTNDGHTRPRPGLARLAPPGNRSQGPRGRVGTNSRRPASGARGTRWRTSGAGFG